MTVCIKINGHEVCTRAYNWCEKNVSTQWAMDFAFAPGQTICYIFKFNDPRDATLFALKWVK